MRRTISSSLSMLLDSRCWRALKASAGLARASAALTSARGAARGAAVVSSRVLSAGLGFGTQSRGSLLQRMHTILRCHSAPGTGRAGHSSTAAIGNPSILQTCFKQ